MQEIIVDDLSYVFSAEKNNILCCYYKRKKKHNFLFQYISELALPHFYWTTELNFFHLQGYRYFLPRVPSVNTCAPSACRQDPT